MIETTTTGIHPSGHRAQVPLNEAGELATGARHFDETKFNTLDVAGTAYNFYKPKVGFRFVMTGFVAFADKDVADNSDTIIVIFEASTDESSTVDKVLFQFGMGKLTVLPVTGIRVLVSEGKFVNAKTGDDDIHMTIMGHYTEIL